MVWFQFQVQYRRLESREHTLEFHGHAARRARLHERAHGGLRAGGRPERTRRRTVARVVPLLRINIQHLLRRRRAGGRPARPRTNRAKDERGNKEEFRFHVRR